MALVWKFSAKVSMNTSPVGLVGNMVVRGNTRSGLTTCYRLLTAAAQPLGTFVALCWDFGPDVYRVGGYQPPHPGCRKLVVDETGQTTRLSLYRISGGLTEFLFLPHRLNGLQSAPLPARGGNNIPVSCSNLWHLLAAGGTAEMSRRTVGLGHRGETIASMRPNCCGGKSV